MEENRKNPIPKDLPAIVWLWIPVFVLLVPYFVKAWDHAFYKAMMFGEFGLIENLTALFLFVAVLSGALYLHRIKDQNLPKRFKWWILLITLGSLYFLGEELSWGQHFVGWDTPDQWARFNDQQETNLHNTLGVFDQLPRALLTAAALVGGVLIPIYVLWKRIRFSPKQVSYWFWPTYVCIPACIIAVSITLPKKVAKSMDTELPQFMDIIVGESKECFLALFLMMYLASVLYRQLQSQPTGLSEQRG